MCVLSVSKTGTGWKAKVSPPDHPVSQYEFDVLIGADGKRNTLDGKKKNTQPTYSSIYLRHYVTLSLYTRVFVFC